MQLSKVFFVREGKLIGRDHYHVSVAGGDTEADVLSNFVKQYYAGHHFFPVKFIFHAS